jgi:hypothetical protein
VNKTLKTETGTVETVAYILQGDFIDEDIIIYFAKFLAKDKNISPKLVREFKNIKSSSSKISPEALKEILTLFGMDKKKVNESVRICDFDTPQWLTDPFIIKSERNLQDYWDGSELKPGPHLSAHEIWQQGYSAINILKELIRQIKAESSDAAEVCTKITIEMVEIINALKRASPKLFNDAARKRTQWPVLRSRHPLYCEAEDDLLANVGKGYDFIIDSSAKWNPEDPGTKIAMDLYFYMDELREKATAFVKKKNTYVERKKILARRPWIEQVANLQDFNRDTALDWWKLAVIFLKDNYPDPIAVPPLAILANAKSNQQAGPIRSADKKLPGNIRRDIYHNIKGKFISLAGR